MPIVGTAGHVDHGKSTLVQALTGTDPDRWAEEKERGLTIDLGFAWTDIAGHDVGFVDVPGHEKFVKNMLAGVGVLDCALLVVAADSGWMPQTEEHAAVLDLLEVDQGAIAITRIDLVDTDTAELATLEVLDEVQGTALEEWPIVQVSSVTQQGLDELRTKIGEALDASHREDSTGFRMWVDRVFTIDGAGIVATGTVESGSVSVGDHVQIEPGSGSARVRGLHHHGGTVDTSIAGSRTAINLIGAPDSLTRGHLLAAEESVSTSARILLALRPTRSFDAIPDKGAFHVHLGTSSRPAALRRLGTTDVFIATFTERLPVAASDRVIVRDTGRRAVIGGGLVLDPAPSARPDAASFADLKAAAAGTPDDQATTLLDIRGEAAADALRKETHGGTPHTGVRAGAAWLSGLMADQLQDSVRSLTLEYHADHPTRPGVPKAELASHLSLTNDALDAIVDRAGDVTETAGFVHHAGFSNTLPSREIERWERQKQELERSFDVKRMSAFDIDLETVHYLLRSGDLVQVGDDLAFTRTQAAELHVRVAELDDGFSAGEFKDHFGMTRRQAIPVLEWLDASGRTRRVGDGRVVK